MAKLPDDTIADIVATVNLFANVEPSARAVWRKVAALCGVGETVARKYGLDEYRRVKAHGEGLKAHASPNQVNLKCKVGGKIKLLPMPDDFVDLDGTFYDNDVKTYQISNDIDDDFLEISPNLKWNDERNGWTYDTLDADQKKQAYERFMGVPETSGDYELTYDEPKQKPLHNAQDGHTLGDKMERWLILPDMQIPYHDQKTLDAVLEYASEIVWDGILQLGDFMDWDFCSRWTKENQRKIEGARFLREYDVANGVLDTIQESVRKQNPDAKMVILEGNHDWRIENVIDKTPALEGLIEMESNLRLKERDITFWRYWTHRKPYVIGNAWFIHGEYIGNGHAKKTADNYHRNVFYGHTHDRQSHTKSTVYGDSVQCESMGTLSVFELEYMGHKPSAWMQCFAEFFFKPCGNFNHFVVNIVNHAFIAINGKEYGDA